MKRVVALACAAVLAATIGGLQAVQSASALPAAPALVAFTPTLSAWKACGEGGVKCSMLTVPLDYAHPDNGRTVKVAVSRLAADPLAGAYAGIMLVNPGGPGGSGLGYAGLANNVPGNAARRYDWIGFDPRGVGASVPAVHCDPNYFGPDRPNYVPSRSSLLNYWVKTVKGYSAYCGKVSVNKAILPHMTTRDTVRDMESLRIALQNALPNLSPKRAVLDKISFYGFSYGTYLAQVYATLYPEKVGRFVMDGVVDPGRTGFESGLDQSVAFDKNLNRFFAWMALHHGTYRLGANATRIRAGYNAVLKRLDTYPSAGGKLGPDELTDAMVDAAYYVFDWDRVARAYADLIRFKHGTALYGMYTSANKGSAANNSFAAFSATSCTDDKFPPLSEQVKQTRVVHKTRPFIAWSNTWFTGQCTTWPAAAGPTFEVDPSALNSLGTKILLISETYDAATPYTGALNVRGLFTGASLIEGVNGTTHAGSLFGVSCVDNAIASYLANGTVPARVAGRKSDLKCPPNKPPAPGSSKISARRAVSPDLRHQLAMEQLQYR